MKKHLWICVVIFIGAVVGSRWLPWWGVAPLIAGVVFALIAWSVWRVKRWWRRSIAEGLDAQGRALLNASVTIHGVRVVPRPEHVRDEHIPGLESPDGEALDEEDRDGMRRGAELWRVDRWVGIDMTIRPDPNLAPGAYRTEDLAPEPGDDSWRAWRPAMLSLVHADTPPGNPKQMGLMDMWIPCGSCVMIETLGADGEAESVLRLHEESDGSEEEIDEREFNGPRRVRMTFSVPASLGERAKLRYVVHDLAALDLPLALAR
jgi:hypothetical protein